MDRPPNLLDRSEVVREVLEGWLLRELRDELVSRWTWRDAAAHEYAAQLRVTLDEKEPLDVYFLSPVGIGGRFFYDRPIGESFYSAEATVNVELVGGAVGRRIARGRLYWVGSGDPKGYRISEGFEALLETLLEARERPLRAPVTTRGFRS